MGDSRLPSGITCPLTSLDIPPISVHVLGATVRHILFRWTCAYAEPGSPWSETPLQDPGSICEFRFRHARATKTFTTRTSGSARGNSRHMVDTLSGISPLSRITEERLSYRYFRCHTVCLSNVLVYLLTNGEISSRSSRWLSNRLGMRPSSWSSREPSNRILHPQVA